VSPYGCDTCQFEIFLKKYIATCRSRLCHVSS